MYFLNYFLKKEKPFCFLLRNINTNIVLTYIISISPSPSNSSMITILSLKFMTLHYFLLISWPSLIIIPPHLPTVHSALLICACISWGLTTWDWMAYQEACPWRKMLQPNLFQWPLIALGSSCRERGLVKWPYPHWYVIWHHYSGLV